MHRKQNRGHELDDNQRLKHENKSLKRENKRLRKKLKQIEDAEEMKKLLHLVELQREEDKILHNTNNLEQLKHKKQEWACNSCETGVLLLLIFKRLDGVFYYRRCHVCGNKTKMKKYKEDTPGITPEQLTKLEKS